MSQAVEQITLLRTPQGQPSEDDFAFGSALLAEAGEGEVRVRVLALSLDPYLRSAMAGRHMSGAMLPGEVVRGEGLVQVVESRHPRMAVGQHWVAACGWRNQAVLNKAQVQQARPVAAQVLPQTLALGVLGMPGLTAWAGFTKMCEAQAGQTLVVSAASGPVGATVGQLARLAGCRVVGIAGGREKCDWAVQQAGFDACIDYKAMPAAALRDALRQAAPHGVHMYFDNVGGELLQVVCEQLALNARVVLCGLVGQYSLAVGAAPPAGPNPAWFIKARATVRGLVVYDHWGDFDTMVQQLSALVHAGQLRYREDISHGLASTPAAFARLMRGENQGKSLVLL
jgi:NADPH-dependent curcumin reductase